VEKEIKKEIEEGKGYTTSRMLRFITLLKRIGLIPERYYINYIARHILVNTITQTMNNLKRQYEAKYGEHGFEKMLEGIPTKVKMPNGSVLEFPAGTTREQIFEALKKETSVNRG